MDNLHFTVIHPLQGPLFIRSMSWPFVGGESWHWRAGNQVLGRRGGGITGSFQVHEKNVKISKKSHFKVETFMMEILPPYKSDACHQQFSNVAN